VVGIERALPEENLERALAYLEDDRGDGVRRSRCFRPRIKNM